MGKDPLKTTKVPNSVFLYVPYNALMLLWAKSYPDAIQNQSFKAVKGVGVAYSVRITLLSSPTHASMGGSTKHECTRTIHAITVLMLLLYDTVLYVSSFR